MKLAILGQIDLALGKISRLPEPIREALRFLSRTDFKSMDTGRIDIMGDDMYASLDRERTAPIENGLWEAHKRYVDVQFLLEGEELIGWSPLPESVRHEDREGEDCFLYPSPDSPSWIKMIPGRFSVFYPEDLHCPLRTGGTPAPVTKVVVKISMNLIASHH